MVREQHLVEMKTSCEKYIYTASGGKNKSHYFDEVNKLTNSLI